MTTPRRVRADLHSHGPIGFEDLWLEKQGYDRKDLLRLIADSCMARELDVSAITSEQFEISMGSIHDRLGYLAGQIGDLPSGYEAERLGESVLVVQRNGNVTGHDNGAMRTLRLISGQTVIVQDGDTRLDHLVVGSNQVPQGKNLEDTIMFCNDNGLLHGLEHPCVESHYGVGEERAERVVDKVDFVEGHNSQLIVPRWLSKVPKLGQYSRVKNDRAKDFARKHGVHWIATSDSHRIQSMGLSHIVYHDGVVDFDGGPDEFLESLKSGVTNGQYGTVEKYERPDHWVGWVSTFMLNKNKV